MLEACASDISICIHTCSFTLHTSYRKSLASTGNPHTTSTLRGSEEKSTKSERETHKRPDRKEDKTIVINTSFLFLQNTAS